MLLKGRGHESWDLLAEEEQKMGNVIFNKGGRYFSMSPEDADSAQSGPVMNFFKDILFFAVSFAIFTTFYGLVLYISRNNFATSG